jgi:hypothetical protein
VTNAADAALDAKLAASFKRAGMIDIATFRSGGVSVPNCDVYVNHGVSLQGDQTQAVNSAITIEAQLAQVGKTPKYGDVFIVGAEVFQVDAIANEDESSVLCIVTPKGTC